MARHVMTATPLLPMAAAIAARLRLMRVVVTEVVLLLLIRGALPQAEHGMSVRMIAFAAQTELVQAMVRGTAQLVFQMMDRPTQVALPQAEHGTLATMIVPALVAILGMQ